MFNGSLGGIESEGTYGQMQRENRSAPPTDEAAEPTFKHEKKHRTSFLKNIETDDLILLGIALLLLLDGDEGNDIFVFIIAALVFLA